jgi:hypothetical protein
VDDEEQAAETAELWALFERLMAEIGAAEDEEGPNEKPTYRRPADGPAPEG